MRKSKCLASDLHQRISWICRLKFGARKDLIAQLNKLKFRELWPLAQNHTALRSHPMDPWNAQDLLAGGTGLSVLDPTCLPQHLHLWSPCGLALCYWGVLAYSSSTWRGPGREGSSQGSVAKHSPHWSNLGSNPGGYLFSGLELLHL